MDDNSSTVQYTFRRRYFTRNNRSIDHSCLEAERVLGTFKREKHIMNMERKKERIEQIANSFVYQLQLLKQNGSPSTTSSSLDDDEVWIQNCIQNFVNDSLSSEKLLLDDSEQHELLQYAFASAGRKWKALQNDGRGGISVSTTATTNNTGLASFSLLDQLNGGGFSLPMSIDEIKEAPSEKERLRLLQKISYIDDILPDFSDYQSLLKSSLESTICTEATKIEYIAIHRKFYDLCRTSSFEYDSIAYHLCQNLLDATLSSLATNKPNSGLDTDFFVALIQNWRDMFLDLLIRDRYMQYEARETTFLLLLRNMDIPSRQRDDDGFSHNFSFAPVHVLAVVDPLAKWFEAWVRHITPRHLVYLLEKTSIVPDLLGRAQKLFTNDTPTEKDFETNQYPVVRTSQLQAVAILSHILCKTRVTLFPWKQSQNNPTLTSLGLQDVQTKVSSSSTNGDDDEDDFTVVTATPDTTTLKSMLHFFLECINLKDEMDDWTLICLNAIETLLWGCKYYNIDEIDIQSIIGQIEKTAVEGEIKGACCQARLQELLVP